MAEKPCNLLKNGGGMTELTGLPTYASGYKCGKLCIIFVAGVKSADGFVGLPKPISSVLFPLVFGASNVGYMYYDAGNDTWNKMVNNVDGGFGTLTYFTDD